MFYSIPLYLFPGIIYYSNIIMEYKYECSKQGLYAGGKAAKKKEDKTLLMEQDPFPTAPFFSQKG